MSKTTIAGLLTGVAGLVAAVALYLKSGQFDMQSIGTAIAAIAAAFGLYKASDG